MWVELTRRLRVMTEEGTVIDSDAFPGRQGRAVFAYLAAHHRPVPRDELAELLWPDRLPVAWQRDLSVIVSRLRSLLRSTGFVASNLLVATPGTYELRLPPVDRGEVASDAGDWEAALAAASATVDRARRPLLPDVDAAWLDSKREELRGLLIHSLDLAARAAFRLGDTTGAARYAREAVTLEPFRERGYVTLMRIQLEAGDRAQALRTYEECRGILASELGVDPAPDTQAVYLEALKSHSDESRATQGMNGAGPALGEVVGVGIGNLPAPVDSFLGRDAEVPSLTNLVRRRRMVTLVGVGGVGKSRLALECARRLVSDYADGAWLCELGALRSPEAVGHAVAAALSVTPDPGRDTTPRLVDALRTRRILVILDNCEHLLVEVRRLVVALCERCPSVHVLATSREPLDAPGEHVWRVQPLALPFPAAHLASPSHRTPALRLFADRARAADPRFALNDATTAPVADICRRVDGLPLAIELAARRINVLSPAEIADRLDDPLRLLVADRPSDVGRQRDLRRTIAWSYELLEDSERFAFESLAVFAGDFDLVAATAVCARSGQDALELVSSLVDKSMVVAHPGTPSRYVLFETLRQYARERLDERGRTAAATELHCRHFVEVAERAERRLRSGEEVEAVAVLDRELANLRAAHAWARQHDLERALRLSAALHWYTFFWHRFELYHWAHRAVEALDAASLPRFAAAASSAANGAWVRGDRPGAAELARRALASVAPDDPERRFPAHVLGDLALFEGRLDDAFSWYNEALTLSRAVDDAFHAGIMLGNRALVRGYQGEVDEALRLSSEGQREAMSMGSPTCEAWSRYVAGEILSTHDPQRAIEALDASMVASRRVQNRFMLGVALVTVSSLRGQHGDPRQALRSFLNVIDHWYEAANWTQQWTALRNLVRLLLRIERFEPAAVLLAAIRSADTAAPEFGSDAERLHDAEAALATSLGLEGMAAAGAQGTAMTDDEVVRFARTAIREALS